MAGLASRVARNTFLFRVIEISIIGIARRNAFTASKDMSGITFGTVSETSPIAFRTRGVAFIAMAVLKVVIVWTNFAILFSGSSAGLAGVMAGRANIRGEFLWLLLDHSVTIDTFAIVASSGAVALAIAVAFSDQSLVEKVVIRDTIGVHAFSELKELISGTDGTVVITEVIAALAADVAGLAITIHVIEITILSVTRLLAFSFFGGDKGFIASIAILAAISVAGLAGGVAGQAGVVIEIEEPIVNIARHNTSTIGKDLVFLTSGTIVFGGAVAGLAGVVAGQAASFVQELVLKTNPAIVAVGSSASGASGVADGADLISIVVGESLGKIHTVMAFSVGGTSSGTVTITVGLAGAFGVFTEMIITGDTFLGEAFAVLVLEVSFNASVTIIKTRTVAGGAMMVAGKTGSIAGLEVSVIDITRKHAIFTLLDSGRNTFDTISGFDSRAGQAGLITIVTVTADDDMSILGVTFRRRNDARSTRKSESLLTFGTILVADTIAILA